MRVSNLIKNISFYIILSRIFGIIKTVYGGLCENIPCGAINSKLPLILDLNHEESTEQYAFYESENKEKATFDSKYDFAFQKIGFLPSDSTRGVESQQIYEAETPSKRSYKVIIYKTDPRRKIEIYLLNGDVISLIKSESSNQYIRESHYDSSKSEAEKKRKERFATDKGLLYSILIVLSIVLFGIVSFGTIYFYKKIKQESRNLITREVMV